MQVENRVIELIEEKIADRDDLFIVSVRMLKNGVLEILLDGDNGISIDDCVKVSRHVGFHLEEENVVDHAYRLEVSSPGVDSALVLPRQYQKNIGRSVKLKMNDGGKREGKLVAVSDAAVTIEEIVKEKGKKAVAVPAEIPLEQIKETKVLISFK
ncbi:ribosome assembly cofactor RimP [Sphingobacterium kyonggiense]|uniref:Ribosome maturation factor RimP n=1 Tax=Sphingobacterium kyonggiense TaxID=714075 RepID=A0ABP7YPU8_9SPHI